MRSIDNEDDYNFALQRIESLMDAEPGSPQGEELARLSELVELYKEDREAW